MNNLPTPETDSENDLQCELAAWELLAEARRERDEAREDADHWKIEYEIVVSRLCGVKHDRDNGIIFEHEIIPKLQRERDEARESLKHISEYGTDEINAAVELRQKLATALVERDEAREKAERYRLEANAIMMQRDEARNAIVGWENKWKFAVDMAARAELERDDAFNKLKELKDILR